MEYITDNITYLINQKKYEEAMKECESLLKIYKTWPDYNVLLYDKWLILFHLWEFEKSLKVYKYMTIDLNIKNSVLYYMMGQVYFELYKYQEALEYYFNALELKPKSINTLNNIGIVYLNLWDYDKSLEYYFKALEIDSQDVDVLNNIWNIYFYKWEYFKALEYYNIALSIDPNDEDIQNKRNITLKKITSIKK